MKLEQDQDQDQDQAVGETLSKIIKDYQRLNLVQFGQNYIQLYPIIIIIQNIQSRTV